ncbi:Holliday junction branch migration protein RuvA [Clostridium sp. AM58-1XD]|uniref:Holliday junction branch migration protein RuvA n=1 Tax=Clostridium sp. AM58-1XD TaxID=2292307 RepID=UPI000E4C74A0|nr:Holliday junction branch migration protein RuvA [Clostridium sp. AM58-1XD]RGY97809.1 Holliday junction branch migration protein RuvA [Clostridium sp. AM58-1XD]
MISYVRGSLAEVSGDRIIIEAGYIGYEISVPLSVMEKLPPIGSEMKIHTYMQVREDGISLFGFLHKQDMDMFKQLIGVSGIGPKGALGILSALSPDSLRLAIISGDAKSISRAPGVGNKTAQRIILDLKDKVKSEDILNEVFAEEIPEAGMSAVGRAGKEAVDALVALGYSSMEAARAVKRVEIGEDMTAEDVLKASLKYLAF